MGGCRCSYKNCQNTTKTTENVHFFHYPVKHMERCKIWIENANKPKFCDLEEDQLRNKVVCEYHFEDRWFPNSQKKRLLQGAVPTLDVGCEEESSEPEMYISTGMQDIQLLPASADGSLFILDTDSIFSRNPNVESFVYKNGMILPSTPTAPKQEIIPKPPISKPSTSRIIVPPTQSYSFSNNHNQEDDHPEYKVQIKNETVDYEPQVRMPQKNGLEGVYQKHNIENFNSQIKNIQLQRPTAVKNPVISKPTAEKANLAKNYLRKIKQHSRDIACIKKMLRQKAISSAKPDTDTILSCLKEQLPPTLFSVLNLNLNGKCELTEEDVDFFTTIHKTSPQVYQLLLDKWNFPSVDIVETPME